MRLRHGRHAARPLVSHRDRDAPSDSVPRHVTMLLLRSFIIIFVHTRQKDSFLILT